MKIKNAPKSVPPTEFEHDEGQSTSLEQFEPQTEDIGRLSNILLSSDAIHTADFNW